MNSLIEQQLLSAEVINAIGVVLKELPYEKLFFLGVVRLGIKALNDWNIRINHNDTTIEINPA